MELSLARLFHQGDRPVNKFADYQLPGREQWTQVGDLEAVDAVLHLVQIQRAQGSTTTTVNELMPLELHWLQIPTADGQPSPAGLR